MQNLMLGCWETPPGLLQAGCCSPKKKARQGLDEQETGKKNDGMRQSGIKLSPDVPERPR